MPLRIHRMRSHQCHPDIYSRGALKVDIFSFDALRFSFGLKNGSGHTRLVVATLVVIPHEWWNCFLHLNARNLIVYTAKTSNVYNEYFIARNAIKVKLYNAYTCTLAVPYTFIYIGSSLCLYSLAPSKHLLGRMQKSVPLIFFLNIAQVSGGEHVPYR